MVVKCQWLRQDSFKVAVLRLYQTSRWLQIQRQRCRFKNWSQRLLLQFNMIVKGQSSRVLPEKFRAMQTQWLVWEKAKTSTTKFLRCTRKYLNTHRRISKSQTFKCLKFLAYSTDSPLTLALFNRLRVGLTHRSRTRCIPAKLWCLAQDALSRLYKANRVIWDVNCLEAWQKALRISRVKRVSLELVQTY